MSQDYTGMDDPEGVICVLGGGSSGRGGVTKFEAMWAASPGHTGMEDPQPSVS